MTDDYLENKIVQNKEYDFLDDIFFDLKKYVPEKIDREVVRLYFRGYKYKEIQRILNIPYGQVRRKFINFINTIVAAMREGD